MTENLIKVDLNLYTAHVETSLTYVGITKTGILEIRFKVDEYEVDVKDQDEIQDAVKKLTNNSQDRYHIIVIPGMYGGVTPEARNKEMFLDGTYNNHLSISIIVAGLPQRILGKFYYHFKKHKPKFPFQLFATEALALKWIEANK
ncbi:MAG: hypothetical protein IPJ60_18170 [Sphingobacteriaceae bacterium]|nr:hypothetical protein [Sphingobacteriaceae bacterium]